MDIRDAYGSLIHKDYQPRIIDARIIEGLEDFGAVCIEGPKYCGKTWTGQAFANSQINLMDPEGNFQNLEIAQTDPSVALKGARPRLIDEWQEVPLLWDGVRNIVDRSEKQETFILTGSSVPRSKQKGRLTEENGRRHSGVGRIEKLRMRPMTLVESGDSNAQVSLKGLFSGLVPSCVAPDLSLTDYCELAARGGWPAMIQKSSERALRVVRSYVREVCESDMNRVDGVKRDPEKVSRLLHSLARNMEQATKNKKIIGDMTETSSDPKLSPETVVDYLQALRRIFVLEEIGPWAPALRSHIRINKRPKYHFVDPSLAVAVLKASAQSLGKDLQTFGFVFECLCIRDLLVYAQAMDAQVYYYRDQSGLEADAIVEAPDGQWAGIEIKLGHSRAEEGARNLKSVKRKIVEAGGPEPAFLAVVEGVGKYAYVREDGVLVVPISTLTA